MAENRTEKNINLQPQSLEAEEAVLGAMMIDASNSGAKIVRLVSVKRGKGRKGRQGRKLGDIDEHYSSTTNNLK